MPKIKKSTNGVDWSYAEINFPVDASGSNKFFKQYFDSSKSINMISGGGVVAGISENGLILNSSNGTTFNFNNALLSGINWTSLSNTSNTFSFTSINSIIYSNQPGNQNDIILAAGDAGQLRSSTDGITWTTQTSNFGTTNINALCSSTSFYDNIGPIVFLAVGNSGQIRTSYDSVTWTTRTSNFGTTNINAIASNSGTGPTMQLISVAVGDSGQIRTASSNPSTWTTRTSNFGTTNIRTVAYGQNIFVAAGDAGQLRSSTDGITWTTQTSNFGTTNIRSIAYGNGLWVAGGESNQMRLSTDGITWTTQLLPTATTYVIKDIKYGDDMWRAVGGPTSGSGTSGYGTTLDSTNGTTWTTVTTIQNSLSNIAGSRLIFPQSDNTRVIGYFTMGVGIAYANGVWLMGSSTRTISIAKNNDKFFSVRRNPFIPHESVFIEDLSKFVPIANGNGLWVAASLNEIAVSKEKYIYEINDIIGLE